MILKRSLLFAGAFGAVMLLACDESISPPVPTTLTIAPEAVTLEVGETAQLAATVLEEDGESIDSEPLVWESSDPGVAGVDDEGLVTALADGTASITATSGSLEGNTLVTVLGPPEGSISMVAIDTPGPMLRTFDVELDVAELVEITYWTAASPRLRVVSEVPATQHELMVGRLIPNAQYQYEVRPVTSAGLYGEPTTGTFISDTLPAGLRTVRFAARGESTHLTMLELRSDNWRGLVVVDQDGAVVWHYETTGNPQGSSRRANGNFAVVDLGQGLLEVAIDGTVVSELTGPMDPLDVHHEVIPTPDNTLLFLTLDGEETVNDTVWVGDRIWEWDPEAGSTAELRWNTFDFYDIQAERALRSRPTDWGHANSLALGPEGNVVVSFNFLNQVASITQDYQAIEWKLGGIESDFNVELDDSFSGQHTAIEVAPGRVLMFDNGYDRGGSGDEFSRGLELELDEGAGTATLTWEFRPFPDNFASIISSARRLENGNTLVHFGTAVPLFGAATGGPIETYEVAEDGEVLWSLDVSAAQSVYRANPVVHIVGETVVPD